jgi:hypothetical protein
MQDIATLLTQSPLTLAILTTIGPALLLGTIVIATVQAIRERWPKRPDGTSRLDGWPVLVVAAIVSLAYCAAFGDLTSVQGAVAAGRIALLAWFAAIGGDAKLRDLATKSSTQLTRTVIASVDPRPEQPTKPEG